MRRLTYPSAKLSNRRCMWVFLSSLLGNAEKPFRIKRENIRLVLLADFRRLDFVDCGAMFVARGMGIKQAAENEPLRTNGFDKLPDIRRAAHMGRIKEDVRRPLGDVECELAVRVRGQRVQ